MKIISRHLLVAGALTVASMATLAPASQADTRDYNSQHSAQRYDNRGNNNNNRFDNRGDNDNNRFDNRGNNGWRVGQPQPVARFDGHNYDRHDQKSDGNGKLVGGLVVGAILGAILSH